MSNIPEHIKTYGVIALALAFFAFVLTTLIVWAFNPETPKGMLLLNFVLLAVFAQQLLPWLFSQARKEKAEYLRQLKQPDANRRASTGTQ